VLLVSLEAGLVGLVVVRDLLLVGGAFYKRASSLGWKVLLYICFFVIHQVWKVFN